MSGYPNTFLLLHASGVKAEGGAYLFLGPSGTGKSTVARLLCRDYHHLSDDTVFLVKDGGCGWGVVDASDRESRQLPGPEEVAEASPYPLRGIFRLVRRGTPGVEPLDALETCKYLTGGAMELPLQQHAPPEVKRAIFTTMALISRNVPGFHYYFNRTIDSCSAFKSAIKDHFVVSSLV